MNILLATEARKNLYKLIDQTSVAHEPTFIKGKRSTAVLLSLEDWEDMKETLHLASIPGMVESILQGKGTSIDQCLKEEDLSEDVAWLRNRKKNV